MEVTQYLCLVCEWATQTEKVPARCERCRDGEVMEITADELADLETAPCKACKRIHTR